VARPLTDKGTNAHILVNVQLRTVSSMGEDETPVARYDAVQTGTVNFVVSKGLLSLARVEA